MAVIINEFEVIPDDKSNTQEETTAAAPPPEQSLQLSPLDMLDVLRFQVDRMLRTWAD